MKLRAPPVAMRYLARNMAHMTMLTLLAFITLFLFFGILDEVDKVGRGTYTLGKMLTWAALQVPANIAELAPVAALIGGIVALAQLASGSEITILRAAGLSTRRLALWIILIALPYAAGVWLVSDVVTPWSVQRAEALRLSALQVAAGQELSSGRWLKDNTGLAPGFTRYANAGGLQADGRIQRVSLYEFDAERRLTRVITAARGEVAEGGWMLHDVQEVRFARALGPLGESVSAQASRTESWMWNTEVSPRVFGSISRTAEEMSLIELGRTIRFLAENQQRTTQLEQAFYQKLFVPLSIIVMLLLALPFAFLQSRAGGVSTKMFAGILLGVLFHTLNRLFSHLGNLNTWPPFITAIAPLLLGLMLAGALLWWVQRTR